MAGSPKDNKMHHLQQPPQPIQSFPGMVPSPGTQHHHQQMIHHYQHMTQQPPSLQYPPQSLNNDGVIPIKNLQIDMKNISVRGIVIHCERIKLTKDQNQVRTVKLADYSGSINLALWNEYAVSVQPADVLLLSGGNVAVWQGELVLKLGKGQLIKEKEFFHPFSLKVNMSENKRGMIIPNKTH
ncbi:hypothetical protein SNEBB_000738 [Seison nebaliae]|nr:hypothetical protein SNEBB_000738 [Seison nebaliae]